MQRLEINLSNISAAREQNTENQESRGINNGPKNNFAWCFLELLRLMWTSRKAVELPLPMHHVPNPAADASQRPTSHSHDVLYLLMCIPHRRYAAKVAQINVSAFHSDQLFFPQLRLNYHEIRGRWHSVFSLRTLKSIKFVQFEMYSSSLADIQATDVIPCANRKDEYRYRPVPAEIIPPVGPNHLMHLYHHPEDAETAPVCLEKIPRKLRQPLSVCPVRGTGLGWGIHFVKGLHLTKLWATGFVGLLASIAFGVCWSTKRDDIQGGFGVTACMMVGLTFTIGIVQAAFETR